MVGKAAAPDIGPRRSWQTAAPAARTGARGGRREPVEEWAGRPAVRECLSISDRHPAEPEYSGREAEDPQRNQRNRAGTLIAFMRRCGDAAMRRCGDAAMRRCGDAAMRRCGDAAMRRCGDCTEPSRLSPCQAPRGTISRAPDAHGQNCHHCRPCSPDHRYGLSPPRSNCSYLATAPLPKEEILWEARRMRREAGIEDVRLHDLRHSMASLAV